MLSQPCKSPFKTSERKPAEVVITLHLRDKLQVIAFLLSKTFPHALNLFATCVTLIKKNVNNWKKKKGFSFTSNLFYFLGDLRDCADFVIGSLVPPLPRDVIFLRREVLKSFMFSCYLLACLGLQFPPDHVCSPPPLWRLPSWLERMKAK